MVASNTIKTFKGFLASAVKLRPAERESPCVDFQCFVDAAKPLVVGTLLRKVGTFSSRMNRICEWLVPEGHDLLAVAGLSFVEDAYTELLAWALSPPRHDEVALECQKSWLNALAMPEAETIERVCSLSTQFIAGDGRPDLVLDYRDAGFVIVVEAKTGSEEHETPGGGMQSVAYPDAVRAKLGLADGFPVRMVFLTPNGTSAENPEAINTTYASFVVALALSLSQEALPDYLRWNYSLLFTHWLTHAAPGGSDAALAIRTLTWLIDENDGDLETALLARLRDIKPAVKLLTVGE